MADLPSDETISRWESRLKTVPSRHRDDARSEAYVAFYEGKDPIKAIDSYANHEKHRERRETPLLEESGDVFAYDKRTGEIVDEARFKERKPSTPRQSIPVRNNSAA